MNHKVAAVDPVTGGGSSNPPDRKYVTKESVTLVVGALSMLCSVLVYAHSIMSGSEERQAVALKERAEMLQRNLDKEIVERQQFASEVNKKLDTIITILATGARK